MGILEDEPPRLEHPALLYGEIEAFLDVMVPFVTEGLEVGEPVVVAVGNHELAALRERVGAASGVRWLDTREWIPHPATRLRAFHVLVTNELARGAARLRLVGEPV